MIASLKRFENWQNSLSLVAEGNATAWSPKFTESDGSEMTFLFETTFSSTIYGSQSMNLVSKGTSYIKVSHVMGPLILGPVLRVILKI
jgi:hypothetical protein